MIALARGRLGLLSALVAASLALAATAVGVAFCVQLGIDSIVAGAFTGARAYELGLFFGLLALSGALLEVFRIWAAEKLGLGYVADVRAQLFDHLLQVSPEVLSQRGQGGLLLPFVGDLTALKKWVSDGVVRLISATAFSVLLLAVLAVRTPALGLAEAAIVGAGILAVLLLSAPLNDAIKETRRRRGAIAAFVSRGIRGAGSIRAFNRLRREAKRLARRNAALVKASLRLARVAGWMTAIVHATGLALVVAALAIGAAEVSAGALSVGGVVAAISVSGLLAGAVRDLGIAFELWRRASVSIAKIRRVLDVELAVAPPRLERAPKQVSSAVSLRGVSVAGLFDNVSLDVSRGEIISVSGAGGSGKSTFLAIVARLAEPERGRVRIFGRDVRDLKVGALRRSIGFAGAATPLLVGTLAMNITYRVPAASDEEVQNVIADCELESTIARLEGGLSFKLSEGAPELSQSERQKVQLARAMLGHPDLLVLDEVDKDFDGETAARLGERLRHYEGAVVMVAASSAWRQRATRSYIFEGGALQPDTTPSIRLSVIDGGVASREGGES